MNEGPYSEETCTVCGNVAVGGRRFSRLYHHGRPFPLCCPMCIDIFQRAPDRFANGEHPRTVVEELLEVAKRLADRWGLLVSSGRDSKESPPGGQLPFSKPRWSQIAYALHMLWICSLYAPCVLKVRSHHDQR
jgi:hypothetical protein